MPARMNPDRGGRGGSILKTKALSVVCSVSAMNASRDSARVVLPDFTSAFSASVVEVHRSGSGFLIVTAIGRHISR